MKKKISLFLCITLIVSALLPVITVALAKKPNQVPPPLEKIVIIHYRKGHVKPPWAGGGNNEKDSGQYKLLGKDVKWKTTPVSYVINPTNPDNLDEQFVVTSLVASAEEWDQYTGKELFDSHTIDYSADWDDDYPDYKNELVFGNYPQQGVIAVTIIWGYFSGPPSTRKIIEFDVLFDTDYNWGYAGPTDETNLGDTEIMDLQNIATHELGHGVGLADLYDSAAAEETMYGYSTEGETKKRTLNTGDKAGIQELYGQ